MVRIGHRPHETEGSPSIGWRVGGEIETVGVAPIPADQRTQKPYQMFVVWLMASASATTPLIGPSPRGETGWSAAWTPWRSAWPHGAWEPGGHALAKQYRRPPGSSAGPSRATPRTRTGG